MGDIARAFGITARPRDAILLRSDVAELARVPGGGVSLIVEDLRTAYSCLAVPSPGLAIEVWTVRVH